MPSAPGKKHYQNPHYQNPALQRSLPKSFRRRPASPPPRSLRRRPKATFGPPCLGRSSARAGAGKLWLCSTRPQGCEHFICARLGSTILLGCV